MIPLDLYISGFLVVSGSGRAGFYWYSRLACIAGSNGAGKSSLLDAITWALFGQARKRDDLLINAQSQAAEVRLTFAYEGNTYRVQRTKPRDKTALLEFHILQQPVENQAGSLTARLTDLEAADRAHAARHGISHPADLTSGL